jgi:hypothetical protein
LLATRIAKDTFRKIEVCAIAIRNHEKTLAKLRHSVPGSVHDGKPGRVSRTDSSINLANPTQYQLEAFTLV